uniref:Uncharacterized protein n=1 Tax=Haptolina brevifila TaxID=156173 RepID=A0A7S2NLU1_9EUKA|mmetsp:Transcript_83146/g.166046  ORF Transcript_83146/g.166046 Transcript_83146/m.166046 type:complete len:153 (+) Transcript_83146:1-459(+)
MQEEVVEERVEEEREQGEREEEEGEPDWLREAATVLESPPPIAFSQQPPPPPPPQVPPRPADLPLYTSSCSGCSECPEHYVVVDSISECADARTALNSGIPSCLSHSTTQWPVGKLPSGCFYYSRCWHFSNIADSPPYQQTFHHRVCKLDDN